MIKNNQWPYGCWTRFHITENFKTVSLKVSGMTYMRSHAYHKPQNEAWHFVGPSWKPPAWFVCGQSEHVWTNQHPLLRQRRYLWGRTECDKADSGVLCNSGQCLYLYKNRTMKVLRWHPTLAACQPSVMYFTVRSPHQMFCRSDCPRLNKTEHFFFQHPSMGLFTEGEVKSEFHWYMTRCSRCVRY